MFFGIDEQTVDEVVEPREHVIDKDGAVGNDDPLDRRMADVPLVPQGNVLHGRERVCPDDAGKTGKILGRDGVPLVRHGGRSLLAFGEILLRLEHLGPLQMAKLDGKFFDRRGDERERRQELGMPVALHHLRRHRFRLEPELPADIRPPRKDRCSQRFRPRRTPCPR